MRSRQGAGGMSPRIRTAILLLAGIYLVLPVAHASAGASLSAVPDFPATVSVGDTGQPGSLSISNISTPPQSASGVTLTSIKLNPSCGAAIFPCSAPDPGVFVLSGVATGATGTACAGATFTVSSPDAANDVTFTPTGSPVVLGAPGSATATCQINFTFSVAKVPTIDALPGTPGVQTRPIAFAQGTAQSDSSPASGAGGDVTTVVPDNPALSVQAPSSATVGGSIAATATIAGGTNPTGSVTINLFGPSDPTCSGPPIASSTKPVSGNGTYTSDPYVPSQPGTYRFRATYSGDVNNSAPAGTGCGAPGSEVVVTAPGDPGGGSAGEDTTSPDTQIIAGPKSKTRKNAARFEFTSTEPNSTFECSLNGGAFTACTSPAMVKGKKGKNTFAVRAKDAAGNVDATPATFNWKVKKKK